MGAKAIYGQMCIVNENIIKNEKWLTRNPKKNTKHQSNGGGCDDGRARKAKRNRETERVRLNQDRPTNGNINHDETAPSAQIQQNQITYANVA